MKRLPVVGLVVVLLLAGCAGSLGAESDDGASDGTSTVQVSASGTASADADLAVVRLGVEATADAADAAREQVARDVGSVRTALSDAGTPAENVTTTAFALYPVYADDDGGGERTVVGYRAVHRLAIETSPDRAGEVIDLAVGAGATTVEGVQFTLSDERRATLRATALDRAMTAARTDADGIAAAANLSVTGVRHVSTGTAVDPYPYARFESVAGGGTTIDPAPVTVTATVDVTYTAA
jgi:hypothetical protein